MYPSFNTDGFVSVASGTTKEVMTKDGMLLKMTFEHGEGAINTALDQGIPQETFSEGVSDESMVSAKMLAKTMGGWPTPEETPTPWYNVWREIEIDGVTFGIFTQGRMTYVERYIDNAVHNLVLFELTSFIMDGIEFEQRCPEQGYIQ